MSGHWHNLPPALRALGAQVFGKRWEFVLTLTPLEIRILLACGPADDPHWTSEIAESLCVPLEFVHATLAKLEGHGFVESVEVQ